MQPEKKSLTEMIKKLQDNNADGTGYDGSTLDTLDKLYKACMMRITWTISAPNNDNYLLDRKTITDLFDDKDMVNKVCNELLQLHYNDHDQIKEALSGIETIVKKS